MTSPNGNIFRVTGPLCVEFTGPGEFPTQRPVTRSFDVFFDLRLYKRLSKQPWGWWFETPSWSLWRHCNDGWRCAILTDGSVIHVSTAWTLHRFIVVFYWYGLIYMHVLSQQWRNKNCELNWINASVYLGLDELTDIIVHDFYNITSVTWHDAVRSTGSPIFRRNGARPETFKPPIYL